MWYNGVAFKLLPEIFDKCLIANKEKQFRKPKKPCPERQSA
jgi:hypothetical protein